MTDEADVRSALRHVLDPELGINIVDLGLVYRIDVDEPRVHIVMTMTSPACPLADYLKDLVTTELHERLPAMTADQATHLGVRSDYFYVRVQVAQDDVELSTDALLARAGTGLSATLWRRPRY